MTDKDDISEADRQLFRSTIGTVKPVAHDRVATTPPKRQKRLKESIHLQTSRHTAVFSDIFMPSEAELTKQAGDSLFYSRPGVQHKTLRRLKRGHYQPEDSLDLHGMTVDLAREILTAFLAESRQRHLRCVCVVHGKGYRSGGTAPVLKNMINNWLQQHEGVVAFSSTRPADGGTGAVYVLLKQPR